MATTYQKPQVVILGAGFGGLRAARALSAAPVQVTLLDRNNYHLFQPLLYQVAAAGLSPDAIAYPVRAIFRSQKNLSFFMTEVQKIDLDSRRIHTTNQSFYYDYLIFSIGGQTNYFGNSHLAGVAHGLKDIDDAIRLRNHILRMFELAQQESDPARRQAMHTIVIAGGGPTGVETAGALSELVRLVLAKDYPHLDPALVRIILVEGLQRILQAMPPDLSQRALDLLRQKHVEVRFGELVTHFSGEVVTLKSGEHIPAHTLIWAAGVRANPLVESLNQPESRLGQVRVEPTLQAPGHPEVFVIGDAAYLEDSQGQPLPMVAPVAMQQGEATARNILLCLQGQSPRPFVYRDPGNLATIGRNAAVAQLGRLKLSGFPAWVLWLIVHILKLIGFRNRLVVLINWVWSYIFYDRAVRLITPE